MNDCRFGVSQVNYPDPDPEINAEKDPERTYKYSTHSSIWLAGYETYQKKLTLSGSILLQRETLEYELLNDNCL